MTECKIIKKCPCCNKRMEVLVNGLKNDYQGLQVCNNDKCKFYGIIRNCLGTAYGEQKI